MTGRLAPWLIRRACNLAKTEGFDGLLAGFTRTVRQCRRRLFWTEDFVIYTTDTSAYALGSPDSDGLDVHILSSESDVERLVDAGYEDPRVVVRSAGRRLRRGAIGFCAFVRREVAHVAWVALDASAKKSFDTLPYSVDFENGEGCWGGALTTRRFRNMGIYKHVMALRLRYCHERGYSVLIDATRTNNAASLKAQDSYSPRVRAVCRYRRRLWWSDWRELSRVGE